MVRAQMAKEQGCDVKTASEEGEVVVLDGPAAELAPMFPTPGRGNQRPDSATNWYRECETFGDTFP